MDRVWLLAERLLLWGLGVGGHTLVVGAPPPRPARAPRRTAVAAPVADAAHAAPATEPR